MYKKISEGIEAKIVKGMAYVRVTNMVHGMLEQGGRINKIYKAPTTCKTIEELAKPYNDYGTTEIDQIISNVVNVLRKGNLIR